MAKVLYKQGTKATYLGLLERSPNALYFCTDTKELFKGDNLYSDGLRIVENYAALPEFIKAADGILYFCKDNGCGYVLNEARNGWLAVVHGVDGETIGINSNGLMAVLSIPIASVSGLDDRLSAVEQVIVGGVRYCGSVPTVAELPTDAQQGDMYEVEEDNSEWCYNGQKWFEYGRANNLNDYVTRTELNQTAEMVHYEVSHKPTGTLVNYSTDEIRVMCAEDTAWELQNSGEGSDPNSYYIGFKAYAPSDDVVSFKEDLNEIIADTTMYYFENNEFAGVDEYGRKYSIVWLPVAAYDAETATWIYHGQNSSAEEYLGWYYSVEWYNAEGIKVAADTIRINLSNEDCHTVCAPFYLSETKAMLSELTESYTWGDM